MHQPHPLHLSLSISMAPFSFDCVKAFLGQADAHAGSSHSRQVTAMLAIWLTRTARMRDLIGLNVFSLLYEQAYSQIWQPTHFSGSAETNFRLWTLTICFVSFFFVLFVLVVFLVRFLLFVGFGFRLVFGIVF